jgi:hypothetical protein
MEHGGSEREQLLKLLGAHHNPGKVSERTKNILDLLAANFPTEHSGVIALALAQAADKCLFAVMKRGADKQSDFEGHLKKVRLM